MDGDESGVPEALGGDFGTTLGPGVPQRGPKDVRSRKSDEKFVQTPFVPYFFVPSTPPFLTTAISVVPPPMSIKIASKSVCSSYPIHLATA